MRRATKWVAFTVIMAMLSMFIMAGSVAAHAWWWQPPPEENEQPAEETQPPAEETGTTEETSETEEQISGNIGICELLVWDDSINPDNAYSIDELVDGIKVELWRADMKDDRTYGDYVYVGTKTTGPGGYGIFGTSGEPSPVYEHGWAGWNELPVKPDRPTKYKMKLVLDNTFDALNGTEREFELWHFGLLYYRWFSPICPDPAQQGSYQIESTTATISGIVFYDTNADLIREWQERRLEGWKIVLTNKYGWKIASTTTNVNGYYQFRGLSPGTYKVWIDSERGWRQVAPYYKLCTWPPWGCEKGHYTVRAERGRYYFSNDFGMIDMNDSVWALLYYALWYYGLLQYQFQ
ncbi:MAG: hypothetical protein JW854_02380 [Actinobacteria bacterium]|nr:hypothetical protein [Actinomycetota bacterium]